MRKNNPAAGLVTPETDRDGEKKIYAHDPYLDPQLTWAGKAEHTSLKVPTVYRIYPFRSQIARVERRETDWKIVSELPERVS
jgi:hypothetical protein